MGELEGGRGGGEVAGEAALEAARAGWFGLVALRMVVSRGCIGERMDERGEEGTLMLRSLQLPQPRRDLRCDLRWRATGAFC